MQNSRMPSSSQNTETITTNPSDDRLNHDLTQIQNQSNDSFFFREQPSSNNINYDNGNDADNQPTTTTATTSTADTLLEIPINENISSIPRRTLSPEEYNTAS